MVSGLHLNATGQYVCVRCVGCVGFTNIGQAPLLSGVTRWVLLSRTLASYMAIRWSLGEFTVRLSNCEFAHCFMGSKHVAAPKVPLFAKGEGVMERHRLVRLSWLVKAQEISETLATPHRLFDADSIQEEAEDTDPFVVMQLIFLECANTGVRSPLERYHCVLLDKNGVSTSVFFAVDLIEGLTELAPVFENVELVKVDTKAQRSEID